MTRPEHAIAAVILLAFSACGGDTGSIVPEVTSTVPEVSSTTPEVTSTGPPEADSVVGSWGLDSISVDGEPLALTADLGAGEYQETPTWIRFDERGNVDGQLPCNPLLGEYEHRGSLLEWEVVRGAAGCVEPLMEAEAPMADLLGTPTVDVEVDEDEGTLVLSGSRVVMAFNRLDD